MEEKLVTTNKLVEAANIQAELVVSLKQQLQERAEVETHRQSQDEIMEDGERDGLLAEAQKREAELMGELKRQEELLSQLKQQLQKNEGESHRQPEDEIMEEDERDKLLDAQRREAELMGEVKRQAELLSRLKQQLQEKEADSHHQPEDEVMGDNVQQAPDNQSSVPKPMQPRRPMGGAGPSLKGTRRHKEPPLPPNVHVPTWDEMIADTEFDNHRRENDSTRTAPSLEVLDSKINMLLKAIPALQSGLNPPRPRRGGKDFKTPVKRVTHPDRNVRNTWVRFHIQKLIGIDKDEDIKDIEELIILESPLNMSMAAFEKDTRTANSPDLSPMRPNLNNINGAWNDKLFDLFFDYCKKGGYSGAGEIGLDDEVELMEIFKDRISSMRKVMKRYRPKAGETTNEATSRAGVLHLAELERQRRNTRRNETYNSRYDTAYAYISVDNPDAEWLDNNTVVSLLGPEGMSSDESDIDDSHRKVFRVKTMSWRNPILLPKLQSVDADRNTTNVYGNSKGGTPPRTRRRKDGRPSARKPPTGKPINFYDQAWYDGLTAKQKRDLDAKSAVRLMENTMAE